MNFNFHHENEGITRFLRVFIKHVPGELGEENAQSIEVDYADHLSLIHIVDHLFNFVKIPVFMIDRKENKRFEWNSHIFKLIQQIASQNNVPNGMDIYGLIDQLKDNNIDIIEKLNDLIYGIKDIKEEYFFDGYNNVSLENINIRKPDETEHLFIGNYNEIRLIDLSEAKPIKNISEQKKSKDIKEDEDLPF